MNRAILFVVLTLFAFVAVAPLAAQTSTENGPHTCNDCSETINVTAPAPAPTQTRNPDEEEALRNRIARNNRINQQTRRNPGPPGGESRGPAWKVATFKAALAQLDRDLLLAEVNDFLETHDLDDCHQIANDPDLVNEAMALIRVEIDKVWDSLTAGQRWFVNRIYGQGRRGRAKTMRALCTALEL